MDLEMVVRALVVFLEVSVTGSSQSDLLEALELL